MMATQSDPLTDVLRCEMTAVNQQFIHFLALREWGDDETAERIMRVDRVDFPNAMRIIDYLVETKTPIAIASGSCTPGTNYRDILLSEQTMERQISAAIEKSSCTDDRAQALISAAAEPREAYAAWLTDRLNRTNHDESGATLAGTGTARVIAHLIASIEQTMMHAFVHWHGGDPDGADAAWASSGAAIVMLAETLLKNKIPHPPITLLFPIAEENGLHGSRMVRFKDLGHPVMGFNLDGQHPNEIVIGAMSAVRWIAEIRGRSTHAGIEPEKGISAGMIASKAMATIAEKDYFGRIVKGNRTGTSNLGSMGGGEASNQVMDRAVLTGECRSHSPAFLEQIIKVYKTSFAQAAKSVTNDVGKCGKVKFTTVSDYNAFRLKKSEPCVKIASKAVEAAGKKPNPLVMDAGLDANNFNEKGLPTVTLGTGSHKFHQLEEYVDIKEYLTGCDVLLNIVALAGESA